MRKPNIIYILADDWGYGDVSCLNPDSKIQTPFTDTVAQQGMTFTDAHSNSAICTPTRYGVLTGRYCWRGRLKSKVLGGYDDLLIEHDRPTVASLLKDAGYVTACIGKWHLGLDWYRNGESPGPMRSWEHDPTVDFSRPLTAGPHTVGFDYSLVIPASLDIPPYCYIENGRVIEPEMRHVDESPRPAFWRAGPTSHGLEHETSLLEFTRRSEQFIADHCRDKPDQPFFLYIPLPSPHTPHVPRKPFQGASACGNYGDYVVEHDWSIGQIVAAIERAGVADDTLFVITSDNGAHVRGSYGNEDFDYEKHYGHRSNHIYRGQKSDAWDGGHRVPFIAKWPGVIEPGSRCDTTLCLTDLFSTCAEIAGILAPSGGEDSISMMPLFKGQPEAFERPPVIHHSVTGQFAIRKGPWKLVACPGSGGWSLPDESVDDDKPGMQLYNIETDPSETMNIISEQSEVSRLLLAELNELREDQE